MLRNYLKTAWNVLQRRRFFTAVSLFGIALTLAVLTLVTALFDHTFAAAPPETHHGSDPRDLLRRDVRRQT